MEGYQIAMLVFIVVFIVDLLVVFKCIKVLIKRKAEKRNRINILKNKNHTDADRKSQ